MKHKFIKKIVVLTLALLLLSAFCLTATAAPSPNSATESAEGAFETYTYWQEFGTDNKTAVLSKPMYEVKKVISGNDVFGRPFVSISDVFADDKGNVYLLDDTNSEIIILDSEYNYIKTMSYVANGAEQIKFAGAQGIYVKDGRMYIPDTANARVLICDLDGNFLKELKLPESRLIPATFEYKPVRVCVDSSGTVYVVSDGSFYGAIVYSAKDEFLGFYGANTVAATATDAIKTLFDRLFSNDVKRGSTVLSLPYQMNDMAIGKDDFIYTATSGKSGASKGQVHILNPGGKDILNKDSFNFADHLITAYNGQNQYENICGIDVDGEGFFYILDSRYGKIYWYDKECNNICVFGGSLGPGEQSGTFSLANAIALKGTDVLVSDTSRGSLTVFSLTDYGKLVREAQIITLRDEYEDAEELWKKVMAADSNSQLAYRGLALAADIKGESKTALKYARLGGDRETYATAFKNARADLLAKMIIPLILGAAAIIAGLAVWLYYKRKKRIVLVKNEEVILFGRTVFHPFESFGKLKEKNMGSVIIATVMLLLFYIVSAVSDFASGFAYNNFNPSTYNSFFVFLRTIGLVLLFVISNWMVCVLLGGIGKIKEIYTVTCYSLLPIVFSTVLSIIFSNILVPDEYVFVSIFSTICLMYSAFILVVGIMRIHDYSLSKFIVTVVLTVVAMVIIVFLLFIIFMLSQQVYGFFLTLVNEITYG